MIKTIQIAAVILAVLAIAALVGSVVLGIRPDPAKSQTLSLPSVVEEFKTTAAASPGLTKTSPLVAQAQTMAKRLDPPPPPRPVEKNGADPKAAAAPGKPAPPPPANFEVVATAVNPQDASRSYALLSQPGKGLFWVKPNDEVNRAVIKQVLPGKIVTMDGREYVAVRPQRLNLLKPGSPPPPGYENYNLSPSTSGQVTAPMTGGVSSGASVERPTAAAEAAAINDVASPEDMKATAEWLKAVMEDPESMGLTKEEAAQLGTLGEMLKDMSAEGEGSEAQDPNSAADGSGESEQ